MKGIKFLAASALIFSGCAVSESPRPANSVVIQQPRSPQTPNEYMDAVWQSRYIPNKVYEIESGNLIDLFTQGINSNLPGFEDLNVIDEIWVAVDDRKSNIIVKMVDINGDERFGLYNINRKYDALLPISIHLLPGDWSYIIWNPRLKYDHFEINGFNLVFVNDNQIYLEYQKDGTLKYFFLGYRYHSPGESGEFASVENLEG